MKKGLLASAAVIVLVVLVILWANTSKSMNVTDALSLTQSEYQSIVINDKYVSAGSSNQYLIDDFIPKLSRYTIRTYEDGLPEHYEFKVVIHRIDGETVTLLDNDYIVINDQNYIIVHGTIDLGKFYGFID